MWKGRTSRPPIGYRRLFLALAGASVSAWGGDFSWNGAADRDPWSTGANWVQGSAPGPGDTVVLPTQYYRAGIDTDIDILNISFLNATSDWVLQKRTTSGLNTLRVHDTVTADSSLTGFAPLNFFSRGNGALDVILNKLNVVGSGYLRAGARYAEMHDLTVTGLTTIAGDAGNSWLRINANKAEFLGGVTMASLNNKLVYFTIADDEDYAGDVSVAFLDGGDANTFVCANGYGDDYTCNYSQATLTIGGDGVGTYNFSGILQDLESAGNTGTLGLRKVGDNTQRLLGNSTYSGTTVIEEGTLQINGNNASAIGAVTVAPGAKLAGYGTIGGATTIGGVMVPSGGNVGTITFVNDLTWNGGATPGNDTDWGWDMTVSENDKVVITSGDFLKGSGSSFRFNFRGFSTHGIYTLVEWSGSTTFSAGDFSGVNYGEGGGNTASFLIEDNKLKVVIAPSCTQPSITFGTGPTVCRGVTAVTIPYSSIAENPTEYSIDFDAAANTAGFVDVPYTAYDLAGNSSIPVTVPAAAPVGVYAANVYVRSGGDCPSFANPVTVTVIDTPATPGVITQGNPGGYMVCSGAAGVTYTISAVPSASTYTWSIPAGATIVSGQGTTQITVNWGSQQGWVYVNAGNSCGTSANAQKYVNVNPDVPDAPTATEATDVSTTAFTANWDAMSSSEVLGYRLDVSELEDFSGSFVVNNLDVGNVTEYDLSGLNEGQTYYYRVRAYNACGTGDPSATVVVLTPVVYAGWDTSGFVFSQDGYGPEPFNPAEADARVTVSGLTRGSGVNTGTGGTPPLDRTWGGRGNTADTTAAIAVGNNRYYQFTVEADPGLQMSFFSFSQFDVQRGYQGPYKIELQYAIDAGAFQTITTLDLGEAGDGTHNTGQQMGPVDLSGVGGLQNVPEGATVTFRYVPYDVLEFQPAIVIYDFANSTANDLELRGTFCATPEAYDVTGGGAYCSDDAGANVGLSDSQPGVTYQLYRNGGATAVGNPVSGTGGAITFGPQPVADTYTVIATRTAGGCQENMNGSVTVTITQTPGAPTNLQATPSSGQVALSWAAPGGTVTGYNVKRGADETGPFITLAAGTNVAGTSFTDTTALDGNVYFYVVTALNDGCEGPETDPAEAQMPQNCPAGIDPSISGNGNITVTVGNSLNYVVSASEASIYCTAPTMTEIGKPAGMNTSDSVNQDTRNRTYSWTPGAGDVGTYPIQVTALDDEGRTAIYSFLVHVGASGESGNGTSTPPPSQSDWAIEITDLQNTGGSAGSLTWAAVDGMTYEVFASDSAFGNNMSWSLADTVQASGATASGDMTEGTHRYYQVVPAGVARTTNGLWAVIKPTVPGGISMLAPPVDTDGSFASQGELGTALAESLASGSKAWLLVPGAVANWTELTLSGGTWVHTSGPEDYTLSDGQGLMIQNAGGTAQPRFAGPVGNTGAKSIGISSGYNIIGLSEGKPLAASVAFESAVPVGSHDSTQADQVWILQSNGSWRQLIRRPPNPGGIWYDTANPNSTSTTSYQLQPGQAYYYMRRGGNTSVSF